MADYEDQNSSEYKDMNQETQAADQNPHSAGNVPQNPNPAQPDQQNPPQNDGQIPPQNSGQNHDKRMNDCLPPILFSAIFKLLKVLPDTELDAC